MTDTLKWLCEWFNNQADGEWEHIHGVELSTLDNPGWRVKIDITDTLLEGVHFERIDLERTENDWVRCWVDDGQSFHGACGPENLSELIDYFRNLAARTEAS